MKKIISLITILIIPIFVYSQDVKIADSNTIYDENYNPIVTLLIENKSPKKVSNITFQFRFLDPNDRYGQNIYTMQIIEKKVACTISSQEKQNIKISLSAVREGGVLYNLDGVRIDIVRYSDGSIERFRTK